MLLNCVGAKSIRLMVVSFLAVMLPATVMADEPVQLIEEITVVGAVRGSSAIVIADIDVVGDESLEEMPTLYE